MEYSSLFVTLMGIGTVFFGLICIIFLTMAMGAILKGKEKAPAAAAAAPAAAPKAAAPAGAAGAAAAGEHGHKKQRADNCRKCAFHTEISSFYFL